VRNFAVLLVHQILQKKTKRFIAIVKRLWKENTEELIKELATGALKVMAMLVVFYNTTKTKQNVQSIQEGQPYAGFTLFP
jgi:DNA polymerase III delta subunit